MLSTTGPWEWEDGTPVPLDARYTGDEIFIPWSEMTRSPYRDGYYSTKDGHYLGHRNISGYLSIRDVLPHEPEAYESWFVEVSP